MSKSLRMRLRFEVPVLEGGERVWGRLREQLEVPDARFFGQVRGVSQFMLDRPTWTIWTAPVSLALIAFIYGAAFIGQGLSNDEMFEPRTFVECTVREVRD